MFNLNNVKFCEGSVEIACKGEREIVMAALSAITFLGNLIGEGVTETGVTQQARMFYAFVPYYRRYSCGCLELIETVRELVAVDSQIYGWDLSIARKTYEQSDWSNGQYAEIINGSFAIVETVDYPCTDCLRKVYHPGQSIQEMTFSHGVCAYRYTDAAGVEARIRGLENIKGEICAGLVNDDLGKIGVYVTGDIDIASRVDMGSYIDKDGMRRFDRVRYYDYLVTEAKDLHNEKSHVEVWVRNPRIQSVWVKAEAVKKYKEVIDNLESDGYTVKVVA